MSTLLEWSIAQTTQETTDREFVSLTTAVAQSDDTRTGDAAAASTVTTTETADQSPTGDTATVSADVRDKNDGGTVEFSGTFPRLDADKAFVLGAGTNVSVSITATTDGTLITKIGETTIPAEGSLETPANFFSAGDEIYYHLSWDENGNTALNLQNVTTQQLFVNDLPEAVHLEYATDWKFAPATGDVTGGGITDFKVYDTPSPFTPKDGSDTGGSANSVVDGTDAGETIDADFRDADGDTVTGGDDRIEGNGGNDIILADAGNDSVDGGTGNDTIDAGTGNDVVNGGAGSDGIEGGYGDDVLTGGTGQDKIAGGNGDDTIIIDDDLGAKGSETDYANGGDGSDTIVAGRGDRVDGGEDTDKSGDTNVLFVNDGNAVKSVDYNADGHSGTITYKDGATLQFANIQSIQGVTLTGGGGGSTAPDGIVQGTNDDDLIDVNYLGDPHGDMVDSNDAILPGDTGDMDVIEAYGGNDTVLAGLDDDEVFAGTGNDYVEGGMGEDLIYGEAGDDTIYGDIQSAVATQPTLSGGTTLSSDSLSANSSSLTPLGGNAYCIDESAPLSLNFDTYKDMVTEDVWFAEKVVVNPLTGQIIGDCDIIEGNDGSIQVQLNQAVTVDTQVVIVVNNGTAQQAAASYEEFTSGVYMQYWQAGVGGFNSNNALPDTQWWVADTAHLNSLSNYWSNGAWAPSSGQTVASSLFSNPTSNNNTPVGNTPADDLYIGTSQLTNDFQIIDDQGNVINSNVITLTVPAGSNVSNAVTVSANVETMVRGIPGGQHSTVQEGDESFSFDIQSIGGLASSGSKTINIEDHHTNVYSPIAFDLTGNGEIDVTGNSTAYGHAYAPGATTVTFDIDADGSTEEIEWLAGTGDGFLIDTNLIGPGNAVDGSALFGDQGGLFANGYDKLDLRDLNGDDELTGAELNGLSIWVDDGDAVLEAGELQTLASNGIEALDTTPDFVNVNGETLIRTNTEVNAETTGDVTYSLSGPDAAFFQIDPTTGEVSYAPGFQPEFDNPADANGDNVYEFNVVRTCDDPVMVTSEPVTIEIKDPCVGDDDLIYGGLGDDLIYGQGGDDELWGNEGDDDVYGGCGDDVINGDTGPIGQDTDPDDNCIVVIDDSPCFCLDLSTTKTMVTEDVWFAEKSIIPPGGMIVGDCDIEEGETGSFKIQLDQPVTQDTYVTIVLSDITANFTGPDFAEFLVATNSSTSAGGALVTIGEEAQYYAQDQAHFDAMEANWQYGLNAHLANPNPGGTATGVNGDAIIGVNNLTNDYELLSGLPGSSSLAVPTIQVLVPAGQSMSEEFHIEANQEIQLSPWQAGYTYEYENDETFRIEITDIGGQAITGEFKDVTILEESAHTWSPIAFDLNWNGVIDVTGNSTAYGHSFATGAQTVMFDIDADGVEEEIEWMAANTDGLLINTAILAANGGVATGAALYGDEGGTYANGYVKLDLLDVDGDDLLTGTELNDLAIWVDDGDGDVEVGEIQTLSENGISELVTVGTPTVVNGETLIRSETTVDAEVTGMVTYSITGPDAAFFQIDPDTGKLTYADGFHPQAENPQDANGDGEYEITVVRSGGTFDQPTYEDLVIKVDEDAEGGDDNLFGGDGNDIINGHGGDDYIEGNDGEDTIDGGYGNDVIYGDTPGDDTGGNGHLGQEVCIVYANVLPGSETAVGQNTAVPGDSVIYTNVATVGGVPVSLKITLASVSDPNLTVDLAFSDDHEIMLNGVSDPAMNDESAQFKFEFFDPATGNPVTLDPNIVFSDLDENQGNEQIYIYDDVANVGVTANTDVNYAFDPSSSAMKAEGITDNPNTDVDDPDNSISVLFETGSEYEIELHARAVNSGFGFGKVTDGDYIYDVDGTGFNDTIIGGWGNDLIYGGGGDDDINSSGVDCPEDHLHDIGYPGLYPSDPDPFNDMDIVYGGSGDDTITTGDDNDIVYGGTGDDDIDSGIDADIIYAGSGDDDITGGEGSDLIYGGSGDDIIYADDGPTGGIHTITDDTDLVPFNDMDVVYGGSGNDGIYGGDDKDLIYGGSGDDTIDGGIDNDCLYGGSGNDNIIGGHGDDIIYSGAGSDEVYGGTGDDIIVTGQDGEPDDLYGGDDRDIFVVNGNGDGDCYDGGTGSTAPGDVDDYDILDLSNAGPYQIINETNDPDGNSTSGTIQFLDSLGNVIGEAKFKEIEEIVCFTKGTMIATPNGEVPVETLKIGDKVLTRDNGMQEIVWNGSKAIDQNLLRKQPGLRPVMIKAGALGHDLPVKDLMVSPNHRVLVSNANTELYFGETEVLIAAKHLVGLEGIHQVDIAQTDYVHFMCERHEVVLSNGAWTESFQPGEQALKGIDDDQREELFTLFPELATWEGQSEFKSARLILKAFEAKLAV